MASGQHLSKELYDLIKSIGETRSKQEEDKIIQHDTQVLKGKISEKNISPKKMKEYLIRAIYIEMLGHDASFAYIHAVNLAQDKNIVVKRIGYLAASLFLGPDDSLLILLVATLQKDLGSKNLGEVSVALNTISKVLCPFIVNAIVEPVFKLLNHQSEFIRKKAVMAMHKIYQVSPSSITELNDRTSRALSDKDPSVIGASLNMFYDLVKSNPGKYKDLTSTFTGFLRQIIEHKLPREYDYHRMPAPWMQIKLLKILAFLGANDQKTSDQIYDIVQTAMKRADDTGINIGYAITYQAVKTIASIYPNPTLLENAATSLSRFLSGEFMTNNNLRFLGINALINIVTINPKYAIDHQMVVVECLESKDETLKRETLDLLFKMTNTNNIETICAKMLHHLKMSADEHFKKELVTKITSLAERFAPGQEWYIQTMSSVLQYGSEHINSNILTNMLKLIEENYSMNPDFGQFLIDTYMKSLEDKDNVPDVLAKLSSWVFGEIGSTLYENDADWVRAITQKLLQILQFSYDDDNTTKGWILSALSKLASLSNNDCSDEILAQFERYSFSKYPDIQYRSMEYKLLSKFGATSKIDIDSSLQFLDHFATQARQRGAKAYDPSRQAQGMMASLTLTANTTEGGQQNKSELKFEHKENERKKAGGETTGLKVQNSKWTEEGYKDDKAKSHVGEMPQALSSVHSKGFGSSQLSQGKGPFTGQGSTASQSSKTFSDKELNPSKQTWKSPSSDPFGVDPKAEDKKKLATELFGNMGGSGSTKPKPAYDPFAVNKSTTSKPAPSKPQGGNIFGVNQSKPQQNQEIDLLDMDDSTPSTTTANNTNQQNTNNTDFDLLGGDDMLGGGDSKDLPSYIGKYEPVKIDVEQFEDKWNLLSQEVSEKVLGKVKSVSDFQQVLKDMNLYFIAEIDGEVLASGRRLDNEENILIYTTIMPIGGVEFQIKCQQKSTATEMLKHFEESMN